MTSLETQLENQTDIVFEVAQKTAKANLDALRQVIKNNKIRPDSKRYTEDMRRVYGHMSKHGGKDPMTQKTTERSTLAT